VKGRRAPADDSKIEQIIVTGPQIQRSDYESASPVVTDNFWCGFFARNSTTGKIKDALGISINLGSMETPGIDLQFDWSMTLGRRDFLALNCIF
jgi:hypothetical protein